MSSPLPESKPLVLPTFGDVIFLTVLLLCTRMRPDLLFADGSVGWHLAVGRYVLEHASVPYQDFISYTFAGKEWIALHWLSDTFMALADRLGGTNGVAVLVGSTIALLFLLLYERCRKLGLNFLLAVLLTITGALASTIHWLARPHVMTFLCTYIFATTLEAFHRRQITAKRTLLTISLTMLVWVNSHPGFVIGFAFLVIYLVSALFAALALADKEVRKQRLYEAKTVLACIPMAALAALINPYGLTLLSNVLQYLGQTEMIRSVQEYQSPVFDGSPQSLSLEILLFLPIFGLAVTRVRPSLPQTLCLVAFAHLALGAVRNIPLYAIVAIPYIAELFAHNRLAQYLRSEDAKGALINFVMKHWQATNDNVDILEARCCLHLLPILMCVLFAGIAINGGNLLGSRYLNCGFDPRAMPTTTLDCIKEHRLPVKQGFNEANWGGYIYWKSSIPIFIDDRASFYGEPFYLQYARVISLYPEWKDVLNKYGITWIIYPKNHNFSWRLKEDPEWRILCEDKASYLFVRNQSK